jgi:hypothetical protein
VEGELAGIDGLENAFIILPNIEGCGELFGLKEEEEEIDWSLSFVEGDTETDTDMASGLWLFDSENEPASLIVD